MVKSDKIRHSKDRREPVTIDLEATKIDKQDKPKADDANKAKPDVTPKPADASTAKQGGQARPAASSSTPLIRPAEKPLPEPDAAQAPKSGPGPASSVVGDGPKFGRPDPAVEATKAAQSESLKGASTPPPAAAKPAPVSPRQAEPPRLGAFPMIAAGVVGGLIALAGGGVLQYTGVLPVLGSSAANTKSIAALQGDVDALRNEIVAKPGGGVGLPELAGRVDGLASALDKTKADIAALAATLGADASPEAMKALEDRFSKLETTVAALPKEGAPPVDVTPLNDRIAALETGLAAAAKAASDASSAASSETSGLKQLTDRVAAIEATLADVSGKVEAQAKQPNAALAIAASSLKAAIDRGDPFMTELETYAAVAPDSPEIAPLRNMAASGVASHVAIAQQFKDAAGAMIAAARTENPNAGVLDKLMTSAQALVQVRPVGTVAGSDAPSIVARMEVAVDKGDYAAALKEYDTLPAPAQAVGAPLAASIKARLAADELVSKVLATALKP